MAVKKIGFDFDKVFVSYPPIIPDSLIDFLYKGKIALMKKKNPEKIILKYRMPGFIEQKIRILSHYYIFRPPIRNNINSLRLINKKGNYKVYLVSSRFGFLKDKTYKWLDRTRMKKDFDEIHFNFKNMQPHIFKEKTLKRNGITHYIDDDLDLLVYLAKKLPQNSFFWLNNKKSVDYKILPENIKKIKNIRELYNKYI